MFLRDVSHETWTMAKKKKNWCSFSFFFITYKKPIRQTSNCWRIALYTYNKMSIISEWKWVISQTGKIYEHHQLKRNSERGERKRGRGKREREGRRERSRQKGDLFFTLTFIFIVASRARNNSFCLYYEETVRY